MAYTDEAVKKQLEVNVVIEIDGEYFGRKQVDSGLVIAEENLIVHRPNVNGLDLDIRQVNTPIGSLSFQLKDEEEYITKKIMLDPNNYLEKPVKCYAGFITGSFDFSEYIEVASTNIKSVTKVPNGYSITSKEVTSLLTAQALNINDTLAINITAVSTTLDLGSVEGFPTSGTIKIGSELITYNGITDNTLENLGRGALSSIANNHSQGDAVYLVTSIIQQNPIDIMLQIMLSKDGDLNNDPTYDVYSGGLGLDPSSIDVATFESIRDLNFTGEQFTLYAYNIDDALKYLEPELLQATNTRLITKNGKISLAILDQINYADEAPELDENVIISTPTWALGSDKISNVIRIQYDFDEATQKYLYSQTFRDEESIGIFGEKKPLTFRFKGVREALDGNVIVQNRASRLLNRLGNPRGKITARAHFAASVIDVGSNVLLTHRYLPQQGAGLGISDQLELISRNIDLEKAEVSLSFEYTSFTGIRIPFIAPSPTIVSVIDQKTVEVPDGSCFKLGYAVQLWSNETHTYLPDDVNYVESINGNIITFTEEFSTILSTDVRIKLAEYPYASDLQKSKNAFVGENSGFFDDDTKSYQILF